MKFSVITLGEAVNSVMVTVVPVAPTRALIETNINNE